MAGEINVSTQKLETGAKDIRTKNEKMRGQLDTIREKMHTLNGSWESEAATATMKKFDAMAEKYFESYSNVLNQYAEALETAASNYETKENTLTSNANMFS